MPSLTTLASTKLLAHRAPADPPHAGRALRTWLSGVGLGLAVVLTGCTVGQPGSPPTPGGGPTPSASTSANSTPGSSPSTSASPSAQSPTPEEFDYSPPAPDGSPDPSTAGGLSAATLPRKILGFTAAVVQPEEGEFDPNGSWVHAMDAEQAGLEAMTSCTETKPGQWPTPTAALQASYAQGDRTGGGLALQFADATAARAWFDFYRGQVARCPTSGAEEPVVIAARRQGSDWLADRRRLDGLAWSESARVVGDTVRLVMVNDDHQASLDALSQAARDLGR